MREEGYSHSSAETIIMANDDPASARRKEKGNLDGIAAAPSMRCINRSGISLLAMLDEGLGYRVKREEGKERERKNDDVFESPRQLRTTTTTTTTIRE